MPDTRPRCYHNVVWPAENCGACMTQIELANEKIKKLRAALTLLMVDCRDYEAWQRPCYALDNARKVLDETE